MGKDGGWSRIEIPNEGKAFIGLIVWGGVLAGLSLAVSGAPRIQVAWAVILIPMGLSIWIVGIVPTVARWATVILVGPSMLVGLCILMWFGWRGDPLWKLSGIVLFMALGWASSSVGAVVAVRLRRWFDGT